MGRKHGSTDMFCDSATLNNLTYMQYLNRLTWMGECVREKTV